MLSLSSFRQRNWIELGLWVKYRRGRVTETNFLEDFPLVVEIPVAWGEMDSLGHVNNAVYFKYFETARMAYFRELEFGTLMETTGVGPILASVQCRFKRPLKYPDTIQVGVRADELKEDRFMTHYRIVSQEQGTLVSTGEGLIVCFDYKKNQKAEIPKFIRDRMIEMEKKG